MMLMAHAYDPIVPPDTLRPELPADLQGVVLRCLEKDPSRRFPDVHSLERALDACVAADQRGLLRPQGATCDIGASEAILANLRIAQAASPDPPVSAPAP